MNNDKEYEDVRVNIKESDITSGLDLGDNELNRISEHEGEESADRRGEGREGNELAEESHAYKYE